jgi:hypothetical protein
MRTHTMIAILSAALVAGLAGTANADPVRHSGQSANPTRTVSEATLRKITQQNIYGQALPNQPNAVPARACADITCPGFALIGIGF